MIPKFARNAVARPGELPDRHTDGVPRLRSGQTLRERLAMARHRSQWYRPKSIVRSIAIRPKVYLAVLVGALAAYLLPATISGNFRTATSSSAFT